MEIYRPHRYPTDYSTHMLSNAGRFATDIVNVHADGASLVSLAPLRVGDRIKVEIQSIYVEAQVIWVEDKTIGVCFNPPLARRQLEALSGTPSSGKPMRYNTSSLPEL